MKFMGLLFSWFLVKVRRGERLEKGERDGSSSSGKDAKILDIDNHICNLRPYLVQCSGSPDTKKTVFSRFTEIAF
jgi:hypothetical protein